MIYVIIITILMLLLAIGYIILMELPIEKQMEIIHGAIVKKYKYVNIIIYLEYGEEETIAYDFSKIEKGFLGMHVIGPEYLKESCGIARANKIYLYEDGYVLLL